MNIRLGIDLGGTKTEIIALARDGTELLRRRVATPRGDYGATVATIAGLVGDAERELGRRGSVGVGIPGAVSAVTGRIKNANSTWLIGQPLQHDLAAALGREVRLANDANCFALSEAVDGAAAGAETVFGVILGTGVGGGVVVRGHALAGANRIAGEWGHNPMPGEAQALPRGGIEDHPPGSLPGEGGAQALPPWGIKGHPPNPLPGEGGDGGSPLRGSKGVAGSPLGWPLRRCYCGRVGCVETFLSGPGLAADHLAATGERLEAEQIVSGAATDPRCEATLARYEGRLARALAVVINILDPDVVVLGGGLSNMERLYERVPRLWGEHVFSDHVATRLVRNRHGDSSGVRGAAWLWEPGA